MEFPAANGNSVDGPGPSSAIDRPSIGIMNDMDIFYGGGRSVDKLKRTACALLLLTIMSLGLVVAIVIWYQAGGYKGAEDNESSAGEGFGEGLRVNGTSIRTADGTGLNFDVCMGSEHTHYLVWLNGFLVATGAGCKIPPVLLDQSMSQFEDGALDCENKDLFIAIEGINVENSETRPRGAGGMLASVTCGNKDAVLTDTTWQCADEPNNNWHDPSSMGQNVLTEDVVKEVVHWKPAEIPKQLHKGKPGKHGAYIWAGASECILDQDGNEACVPPLSVFCRKVINTETLANRTTAAEAALANICGGPPCSFDPDSADFDPTCKPTGLFYSMANFVEGIGGLLLMLYMFIAFHIICDDFFVPSLNVLCEKCGLSDDIAGATFMAAGASSPELFASLIGVLTGSAVGAGTVVGSELFNMLVIVGGVCLVSEKALTLDWRPLAREVFFFTLSLILVIIVLSDEEVHTYEAIGLMCGYAAYVAVCAKYKTIMKIFCPATAGPGGSGDEEFYIDFNLEDPVEWDQTAQDPGSDMRQMLDLGNPRQTTGDGAQPLMPNAMDENRASLQLSLDGAAFGMDYGEVIMHGFMYKKSEFYAKARMSSGMWQKRWCVIDDTKFFYTRKNGKDRVLIGGPSSWSECRARSTTYTEFILTTPGGEYVFKCAKPAVARKWLRAIAARIEYYKTLSPSSRHVGDSNAAPEEHAEEIHDLLAWPATIGGRAWFIFVCPLLVIFRYTVPDVRYPRWTNFYPATMIIAVCWLAVLAEGMMTGAENSGRILEIPEDIMGLTVTAAGTSLPNLFASLIVAKQGLGNMSVSNAFGSNTFNIFVALAFPWFVGSMVKSNWVPPHGTQSYSYHVCKGHIFSSVMILGGVLTMMVFFLVATGMKLTKNLGYFFNGVYVVFITYLIWSSPGLDRSGVQGAHCAPWVSS